MSNLSVDGNLTVAGTQTISGGTSIGDAATDTVGFYGAVPVVQATVLTAITTTTATLTVFGFQTSAQFNALIANVNAIIADLKTIGLMATA